MKSKDIFTGTFGRVGIQRVCRRERAIANMRRPEIHRNATMYLII
jgi:hypothetical protein